MVERIGYCKVSVKLDPGGEGARGGCHWAGGLAAVGTTRGRPDRRAAGEGQSAW